MNIVIIIFLIIAALFLVALLLAERPALPLDYHPVDEDRSPKIPTGFKGTPYDKKQRFIFEPYPFYQSMIPVLAWLPSHFVQILLNRKPSLHVHKPASNDFLHGTDCLIWLGHASYFLRMNGKNLLVDPHFSSLGPYHRKTENPVDIKQFISIDYILITHDHADHCDEGSLKLLLDQNPGAIVLAGKNMKALLQSFITKSLHVEEALWYERFPLNDLDIYFVPSRHYSKRIFKPYNSTLWGGFVISFMEKTLFISADSGYGPHFKEVGELFHPGISIIGTGAYKPGWFMRSNHMNPEDAVKAFKDTGASLMIPSHYGTFNLGNETVEEVELALMKLRKTSNILPVQIGQVYELADLYPPQYFRKDGSTSSM